MRARRRPLAVPFLTMLVLVALAGACAVPEEDGADGPQAPKVTTPRTGGKLIVGTTAEADGFLPAINRWTPPSFFIARAIFDPLTTTDEAGTTKPYLAESFTPNATFTQWTIKLRPGVKFHDKSPLTTEALTAHFNAARNSLVTKDSIAAFDKYSSPDPLTFVIDLKMPWASLPTLMSSQIGFLPAPSMYREGNDKAASNPVGTGPFRFTSWRENDRLVVDRNTDYWRKDADGRQLPYLSQVEFQPVPDDSKRTNRLRSGELDVVHTDAYNEVSTFDAAMRTDPDGRVRALLDRSQGAEAGIVLNTQTGPFTNPNLRLAAAYAIDRQGLIDEMFKGFYELANGPFSTRSRWGAASNFPTYFPERARQLITEWRANGGRTRPKPVIRLTNINVADSIPVAQRITKAWTDVGFDVQLTNEEEKVASVGLVTGASDAVMLRFWDRPDPDSLYHFFAGSGVGPPGSLSLNFSRYQSQTVDQALKAARGSNDDSFRRQQYQLVWEDFAQNLPILFLFHTRWAIGYQQKVHGLGDLVLPDGSRAEPVTWGNLYLTGVWVD